LSVVLVAIDQYEIIERTVAHLCRQTIAGQIELVVMARCPERLKIPRTVCDSFSDVRIVDIGPERRMGAVRAEGLRQARAPYVAMAEDHCYPNAVWAASLVAQHDAGADVVGPRMVNCNPETATSWAAYLIAYSAWTGTGEPRNVTMLPGHNSSYRRHTMLQFGDELDLLMSCECVAHWALAANGSKLVWEPGAQCRHVNLTCRRSLCSTMYHHGRIFGAARTRNFNTARRLLYVLASPLIPALRVYRAWPAMTATVPQNVSRWKVRGVFTAAAVASTVGEALGMAAGVGTSPQVDWRNELDRRQLIRPADWYLIAGSTPAGDREPAPTIPRDPALPVRIGLIGCGSIACNVHLRLLARRRDVSVVALADPLPAAREAASRWAPAARLHYDVRRLIDDERVEAVLVCAPASRHAELAVAVLDAGKHLYLEKPIATSVAEAEPIMAAWRRAGCRAMIGFNYRYHPSYVAMRHAIVRGEIGNVVSVRVTFCTRRQWAAGWRLSRDQGGGVLLELASHEIDLVHFVLGERIAAVTAQIYSRESEDDTAYLQGSTASGIGVQGFFSFCAVEEAGMEVYGDAGKLSVDRYGGLSVERRSAPAAGAVRKTLAAIAQWRRIRYLLRRQRSPWREPSFEIALSQFLDAVRRGTPASPDLNDGLQSLMVIEAAELAARHGRIERVADRCAVADDNPATIRFKTGAARNG
jgi:predicted dehydrogenase